MRALVVDDQEDDIELARRTLELSGFDVSAARNSESAVALIKPSEPFGIAFIDLRLHPYDLGCHLIVRSLLKCNPHIPIVLLTGYARPDVMDKVMQEGYVGIAEKPLTKEALARIVALYHIEMQPVI